jgi:hypothetical protein
MKAACVQAAATLIAARDSGKDQIDVDECVTLAALIYVRVATTDRRERTQHAATTDSVALSLRGSNRPALAGFACRSRRYHGWERGSPSANCPPIVPTNAMPAPLPNAACVL